MQGRAGALASAPVRSGTNSNVHDKLLLLMRWQLRFARNEPVLAQLLHLSTSKHGHNGIMQRGWRREPRVPSRAQDVASTIRLEGKVSQE